MGVPFLDLKMIFTQICFGYNFPMDREKLMKIVSLERAQRVDYFDIKKEKNWEGCERQKDN